MSRPARLDHVIVLVHDLNQAMDDYCTLGFTVNYGGEHADGLTHNALITLTDGSYIELLAPTDPNTLPIAGASPGQGFLRWFSNGLGFGGYALRSRDLISDLERLKQSGIEASSSVEGGRRLPDGQVLHWRTASTGSQLMPFLIEDFTPRQHRVSSQSAITSHANGATGIAVLLIQTPDLGQIMARYTALFGHPTESSNSRKATWAGEGFSVRVTERAEDSGEGDRLVQIVLSAKSTHTLHRAKTHGAIISLAAYA